MMTCLCACSAYVEIPTNCRSVVEYVHISRMNTDCVWGSHREIFALSHLLRTRIYSFSQQLRTWQAHLPCHVDPSLQMYDTDSDPAMFLYYSGNHFMVVQSIL